MAIAIKLPDMGTTVDECKLLEWKVKEGDAVKRGDVLADIETDKAVAELESTAEGILLQCRVPAGSMARTGDILAYVGQPGETIPADASGAQRFPATTPPHSRHPSSSEEGSLEGAPPDSGGAAPPAAGWSPVGVAASVPARISPLVRNLAVKLSVDLNRITGTGAGGTITREDVQRAHQALGRE